MELFPLTLPEIMTDSWQDSINESKMVRWLKSGMDNMEVFNGIPGADENYSKTCQFLKNYLQFGSMPAIIDSEISSEEKYDWLYNYIQTYLQRDIRNLANMKDLEPFVLAQKTLAGLTGQIINYNNMARLSGISPKTAKRFISYLELSYQVILLQPWFRNLNKRLTKSPKLHFLDPSIQKTLLFRRGVSTGHEFESAIIAEIYKQIKSFRLNVQLYHLRTFDGREIDLLMEMGDGFVPIEIKTTERVSFADAKHLRMTDMLDKPIIHSLILSNDNQVKRIDKGIKALPVAWFLG